jgi:hypothetical protein
MPGREIRGSSWRFLTRLHCGVKHNPVAAVELPLVLAIFARLHCGCWTG